MVFMPRSQAALRSGIAYEAFNKKTKESSRYIPLHLILIKDPLPPFIGAEAHSPKLKGQVSVGML